MEIVERLKAAPGIKLEGAETASVAPDCVRACFALTTADGAQTRQRALFMSLPANEYSLIPITARDATGSGSARLSDIYEACRARADFSGEVVGALNGGFFIFIERLWSRAARFLPAITRVGDPIGWRMTASETKFPPLYGRAALMFGDVGGARRANLSIAEMKITIHLPDRAELRFFPVAANREVEDGAACYTPAWSGKKSPNRAGALDVAVTGGATAGARAGGGAVIPINGFVLSATQEEWGGVVARDFSRPARVSFGLNEAARAKYGEVRNAIEAGPELVADGRALEIDVDFLCASGFAPGTPPLPASNSVLNHHKIPAPRTCVGITERGDIVAAIFEGRMPGVSEGVTLTEAARLMLAAGCRDAVNLDGGASSQMIVRGESLNEPQLGEAGGWMPRALRLANRFATPGTLPGPDDIGAGGAERAIGDAVLIARR